MTRLGLATALVLASVAGVSADAPVMRVERLVLSLDGEPVAVSAGDRYVALIAGSRSSRRNARNAAEPPTRGAISRSESTVVGPVRSRRRSVFSMPTRR